jgi:2-oxoglutarate dehydrogenase complex dehydrogenase (E1) component-like enzyme
MTNILVDPQKVEDYSKQELVEVYDKTRTLIAELQAQQKAISELLVDKIAINGEVIGNYAVTQAKRPNWFPGMKPKEKLEKAKELGAVKTAIDSDVLKRLFSQGIEIPHDFTRYVIVKEIEK